MFFEEFVLGTSYALEAARIDEDKMIAFAKEYDPLPIHLDKEYAAGTHYGRLIAPGVMSFMAVWRKFLDLDVLGGGLVAGIGTSIEWLAPVYAGDLLRGEAKITALQERNAYTGIVEITVWAYNENGTLVIKDITRAVVKKKQTN